MPFLGTSYDDPQTQGILSLAGQMIRGDVGGGVLAYADAMSPQNRLKADMMRAQIEDTKQQIGLRNIQLRQQQAQWDMLAPIMRRYAAGATGNGDDSTSPSAPSAPSTPDIAPSPGGALGSGTFGIPVGGQRASAPPAAPVRAGGGGSMFGVPYSVGAPVLMFGGPQKFAETISSYNAPNDFVKMMRAANIDPDSEYGRSLLQQNIKKQNYIAPVNARPGAILRDPITNKPIAYDPQVPVGTRPVFDENGNVTDFQPIRNAEAAISLGERAKTFGKAQSTPSVVYDQNGTPQFSTVAQDIGRAGGAPGLGGAGAGGAGGAGAPAAPAAARAPQAGDTDMARIYADELSKAQARLSEIQNDPRRTPQLVAAAQSDVDALTRLTQKNPLSQSTAPSAAPRPAANVTPQLAPGQSQSLTDLAKANTARYSTTISQAADSPTRVNVYDNILHLSQSGVNSGPGQAWKNTVKGYVANTPLLSSVTQGWRDDVSGFQELNKFLYQNAQRNWQAAGGTGTDAQLEAFTKSNPNDKMFPQALQAMAQWGKAGELALQGKANAMQAWKDQQNGNLANMDQFERSWRNAFDPVLFQMKTMDPAAQKTYIQNLKMRDPKAYDVLVQKAQTLKQLGGL